MTETQCVKQIYKSLSSYLAQCNNFCFYLKDCKCVTSLNTVQLSLAALARGGRGEGGPEFILAHHIYLFEIFILIIVTII